MIAATCVPRHPSALRARVAQTVPHLYPLLSKGLPPSHERSKVERGPTAVRASKGACRLWWLRLAGLFLPDDLEC
jgi:hypothetical protein